MQLLRVFKAFTWWITSCCWSNSCCGKFFFTPTFPTDASWARLIKSWAILVKDAKISSIIFLKERKPPTLIGFFAELQAFLLGRCLDCVNHVTLTLSLNPALRSWLNTIKRTAQTVRTFFNIQTWAVVE